MDILKVINLENVIEEEKKDFSIRNTARAVIVDDEKKIALINISKEGFHQLIGGGINKGESVEEGLIRESKEEAGVDIEILGELGIVVELKKEKKQIQNSYSFIAQVASKKIKPQFTRDEIERRGFKLEWMCIDEAIKILKEEGYNCLLGQYSYERDLVILEEANNKLIKYGKFK